MIAALFLAALALQEIDHTKDSLDTVKAALFNNTGTPDKDAAVASTGYNTGAWVTGNEVTGSSEWVAAGRALA